MADGSTFDYRELARKWPSAIVARTEARAFSGGAIDGRTLANLESLKNGGADVDVPLPRLQIGPKVCYPATALAEYLQRRAERMLQVSPKAKPRKVRPAR